MRSCRRAASGLVPLLLLAACGAGGSASGPAASASGLDGEVVVFAAASLTDVVDELAAAFALEHPDVEVVVNLAGSQTLAAQLLAGAPADVFAAADPTAMDRLVAEGLADGPAFFAENQLEIVVEPGNPLGLEGLSDLARDDVVLVLPAEQAAAGRYAAEVLAAADVEVTPSSLEVDVRAATSRVAMGEADAAIVFRTDRLGAGERVDAVSIPASQNVTARYPVATLARAPSPEAAAAFVELLLAPEGRAVLEAAGFTVPR